MHDRIPCSGEPSMGEAKRLECGTVENPSGEKIGEISAVGPLFMVIGVVG